jgi:hypothetical protein
LSNALLDTLRSSHELKGIADPEIKVVPYACPGGRQFNGVTHQSAAQIGCTPEAPRRILHPIRFNDGSGASDPFPSLFGFCNTARCTVLFAVVPSFGLWYIVGF